MILSYQAVFFPYILVLYYICVMMPMISVVL